MSWTILENEIIYVLICFEQSIQILKAKGLNRRWGACSDDVEEKIGHNCNRMPNQISDTFFLLFSFIFHMSTLYWCAMWYYASMYVWHGRCIYMAPNHKRENQIKSIIKSAMSPFSLCLQTLLVLMLICLLIRISESIHSHTIHRWTI